MRKNSNRLWDSNFKSKKKFRKYSEAPQNLRKKSHDGEKNSTRENFLFKNSPNYKQNPKKLEFLDFQNQNSISKKEEKHCGNKKMIIGKNGFDFGMNAGMESDSGEDDNTYFKEQFKKLILQRHK